MHIWEDHFLVEVIDPETGKPLPDGEEGELVFTTLTKETMPLLRYRTGDISSLNRQAMCMWPVNDQNGASKSKAG